VSKGTGINRQVRPFVVAKNTAHQNQREVEVSNRQVTATSKTTAGEITKLCGEWGAESTPGAIAEIENGIHRYFTVASNGSEIDVKVLSGEDGKYLRTDPDKTSADNLVDLPDC
jgi:Protein of unknown function (DUF3892)